ncbi:MAG: hypothetical protein RR234_08170 [Christensenella sp.]
MNSPNEFYYGFSPPDEPPLPKCPMCGTDLVETCSTQYIQKGTGDVVGCDQCLNKNDTELYICDCVHFNKNTENIYTYARTDIVVGCSECITARTESFYDI